MNAKIAKKLERYGVNVQYQEAFGNLLENTLYRLVPLIEISDEKQYGFYLDLFDQLMDLETKSPEEFTSLTLNGLYFKDLSAKIEEYESKEFADVQDISGVEVLKYLMEANGLTQSDFEDEIGPQSNVSAILSGKRKFTIEHVEKLSKRFKISPAAFIGGGKI